MTTADMVAIAVGIGGLIATVLLGIQNNRIAERQNEIFREQNRIFAAQAGMKMPDTRPNKNKLGLYWPALATLIVALVVAVVVAKLQLSTPTPIGAAAVAIPWALALVFAFFVTYLRGRVPRELSIALTENAELKKQLTRTETQTPSPETIHTIRFDYLPRSPLENGWTLAYKPESLVEFATDPEIPGSLRMTVKGELAIDHPVPPHGYFSDRLLFKVRVSPSTMIFTKLEVWTKDRSQRKSVWVKFYTDRTLRAARTPGNWHDPDSQIPEQTVWLPAKVLENGVMEYDIDFHKSMELALGNQGWVYNAVLAVRLRGNLSISPLVFNKRKQ